MFLLYIVYNVIELLIDGLASKIKMLLSKFNFTYVWDNQYTFSKNWLFLALTKELNENYILFIERFPSESISNKSYFSSI